MSYSSWSVVFGEQPSAAKWNILGTNDAYFNTQTGSGFSSGTTSTVWWEELGRGTLSGTADTITATLSGARKYMQIQIYTINSGATTHLLRFNSDSGNNYSYRYSANGGADTSANTQGAIVLATSESSPKFSNIYVIDVSAQEKLVAGSTVSFASSGVGSAPTRWENFGKWVNTSSQVTSVSIVNDQSGDFASGSELVVKGHD